MTQTSFNSLRQRHRRLTYRRFDLDSQDHRFTLRFTFELEPNLTFHPRLSFPQNPQTNLNKPQDLAALAFNLGLIELLSYWKAACPPEIVIEAGTLSSNQISWWQDLFLHGLGEFFYTNRIRPDLPNLISIKVAPTAPILKPPPPSSPQGDLILVGGGKDSAVTLDLTKNLNSPQNVLLINPTPAALKTAQVAGFPQPIIVTRTLDPLLLKLNSQNYLNGHTPFSAYIAFQSLLVAYLHGFNQIIVSNEASAGEGSLRYHQLEINHQYSKSYRFERLFRTYTNQYLSDQISYFSFLRPLTELQVASIYQKLPQYDSSISSCNVTRNLGWCGQCPKCAFVYLLFSALLPQKRLTAIFGSKDFFTQPAIQAHLTDLVGLGPHKPLDCVGTLKDSQTALILVLRSPHLSPSTRPFLLQLAAKLDLDITQPPNLNSPPHPHFLPAPYLNRLLSHL